MINSILREQLKDQILQHIEAIDNYIESAKINDITQEGLIYLLDIEIDSIVDTLNKV